MHSRSTPVAYRPTLSAAIPAGLVKSVLVAAIITALTWLFVDQMNGTLAAVTFGGLTVVFSVLTVGNLRAREYEFHDDHVEASEGFLTTTHDSVPYNRITDVGFTKSVWQRIFNVGTVRLNTAGSDQQEITISYVDDPEAVYDEIATKLGD